MYFSFIMDDTPPNLCFHKPWLTESSGAFQHFSYHGGVSIAKLSCLLINQGKTCEENYGGHKWHGFGLRFWMHEKHSLSVQVFGYQGWLASIRVEGNKQIYM